MRAPGFDGWTVKQVLSRLWRESLDQALPAQAAGLAYYAMLAVFPFLIFLVALMGFVPIHDIAGDLIGYVQRVAPPDAASVLAATIRRIVTERRPGILVLSALGAAVSAGSGVLSMMGAIDRISAIPSQARSFWRRSLVAMGITVLLAAALIVTLVLLAVGGGMFARLLSRVGAGGAARWLWDLLRWPVAALVLWATVALIYWIAPSIRPPFRWVTPGTLVAVPLWLALTLLFGVYVGYVGSYSRQYGPFASVIVLLVWFYLDAVALLVGVKLNTLALRARGEGSPSRG